MKKYFLLIFILPVFFFSCKKEDPQSETGTPVFYARGTLNGNPFNIRGGVGGYYMYSSYSSDALDIYQYSGNLKEENCSSGCPQSMAVHIRDYSAHTNSATNIDSALAPGNYSFVLPNLSTTVGFTSQLNSFDTVLSYSWDFGDAVTSGIANPVHTYATTGYYNVCLTVAGMHNSHSSFSSICDSVNIGGTTIVDPIFTILPVGGDSLYLHGSATGGTLPYSYYWRFGDGYNSYVNDIIHQYPYPGAYTCEVSITDANNITASYKKNICTPLADSSYVNFTWQSQPSLVPDLSKVIIEWTDASGNVYTSANPSQPTTSTFQIISVENFQANENQQATKKIHMNVNCTLYNGTNTLFLQNADIVFAMAHQ